MLYYKYSKWFWGKWKVVLPPLFNQILMSALWRKGRWFKASSTVFESDL